MARKPDPASVQQAILSKPMYPQVHVRLVGEDGNAFSILARCQVSIRKAGLDDGVFDMFGNEATSGDYNHLLRTVMRWFTVDGGEDEEAEDWY